ncbi:hypothetical protein PRK78_007192 [Emydomyces testavorans]|uniref:Uncharacterized protein n=1 Tax=Emydomyces testavorans TaxID=2070801 RepID=A0AAF0DRM6_9EURO|nr:hypothetical protein PRK78_007192 [Emydomyces testavorans]
MNRGQKKIGIAKSNGDDHTAHYLLEELSSRRRLQSSLFNRKVASSRYSWLPKSYSPFYSFLTARDSKRVPTAYRCGKCAERPTLKPTSSDSPIWSVTDPQTSHFTPEMHKRWERGKGGNSGDDSSNDDGWNNGKGDSHEPAFGNSPNEQWNGNQSGPPVFVPPSSAPSSPKTTLATATEPESPLYTTPIAASTPKSGPVTSGTATSFKITTPSISMTSTQTGTVVSKTTGASSPCDAPSQSLRMPPSSPSIPGNLEQEPSDLAYNPARVTGAAVGITISALLFILLVGWVIMRYFKKRRLQNSDTDHRNQLDGSWANEKGQSPGNLPPKASEGLDWDPTSTFAPPFVKSRKFHHSRELSSASSIIKKILDHARKASHGSALLHVLDRQKPLPNPPEDDAQSSLTKHASGLDEMPAKPEKAHATISTRSSELFPLEPPRFIPAAGQSKSQIAHGHGSISKFSWSTPTTKTTSIASLPQTQRFPSLTSNYAGTLFSEDSEPPRFRTTSSWVLHQQASNLRRKRADSAYTPSSAAVPSSPSIKEIEELRLEKVQPTGAKRVSV